MVDRRLRRTRRPRLIKSARGLYLLVVDLGLGMSWEGDFALRAAATAGSPGPMIRSSLVYWGIGNPSPWNPRTRSGAASAALNPKLPPWLCTTTMQGQTLSTSAL